jgi:Pyruvate/2-oxoacid:ferredoxin oxidoreductase gamma subunit
MLIAAPRNPFLRRENDVQTEIQVTGIGGQGVQFATRTIAAGAMAAGRTVMLTSEFGGEMRGGISTATLIVGDPPLQALPVVPTGAAVVALHDKFWPLIEHRLRPGGLLLVNSSLWERPCPPDSGSSGCRPPSWPLRAASPWEPACSSPARSRR